MRLSVKGTALASGLIWGGGILVLGLLHSAKPSYGGKFLEGMSSVYPGLHGGRSVRDAVIGGGYALADGATAGMLFAWLYNQAAARAA